MRAQVQTCRDVHGEVRCREDKQRGHVDSHASPLQLALAEYPVILRREGDEDALGEPAS